MLWKVDNNTTEFFSRYLVRETWSEARLFVDDSWEIILFVKNQRQEIYS